MTSTTADFALRYAPYFLWTALVLAIVSTLLLVVFLIKISGWLRLNRLLLRVARDSHFLTNLERAVEDLSELRRRVEALSREQEEMTRLLRKCTRTPVVKRFAAFADVGGDLSFSLALLDGEGNGVIITSLYGREESRTYAKQVAGGVALNRISSEEEEVLQAARQQI